MEYKLKFGLFLTYIWASSNSLTQISICQIIFNIFSPRYEVDSSCAGHMKGCNRNLPIEITSQLNKINKDDIRNDINKQLIPCINESKKLVNCLIYELKTDNSIDNDTKIGSESSYTKAEYIGKKEINLSDILTDFLIYTVRRNENKDEQTNKKIKTITKKSFQKMDSPGEIGVIIDLEKPAKNLPLTMNSDDFENVFTEIANEKLCVPNENNIHAYLLNSNAYRFDYRKLEGIISENILNYVYSRKDFNGKFNSKAFVYALNKLRENYSYDELGQILLYIFLEHVLGAPKLMSKLEMRSNFVESDGMFLNNLESQNYQIVLGTSKLYDSITKAVDNIITKVSKIVNSGFTESALIIDTNFKEKFDESELRNLEGILKPSKNNHLRTNAFGIFIGYSLKLEENKLFSLKESEACELLKTTVKEDLKTLIIYLNEKITSYKLQEYSYYVYLLPFHKVIEDTNKIMLDIIGGNKIE